MSDSWYMGRLDKSKSRVKVVMLGTVFPGEQRLAFRTEKRLENVIKKFQMGRKQRKEKPLTQSRSQRFKYVLIKTKRVYTGVTEKQPRESEDL